MAVLLVGPDDHKIDMPVSLLPYVYEGAVLTFTVDLDTGEETRRRSRVRSLLDKLQRTDRGKG